MKCIKKLIFALVLAVVACLPTFAKEELDETHRIELNASEYVFGGFFDYGVMHDLAIDFSWLNDSFGLRFGVMTRESWNFESSELDSDDYGMKFSWCPYVGVNIMNGCITVGFLPDETQYGDLLLAPYCGLNWDIDLVPVRPGVSHSLSLRMGLDMYMDPVNVGDDFLLSLICTFLKSSLPRGYVGLTYKFGCGFGQQKKAEKQIQYNEPILPSYPRFYSPKSVSESDADNSCGYAESCDIDKNNDLRILFN